MTSGVSELSREESPEESRLLLRRNEYDAGPSGTASSIDSFGTLS